MMSSAPMIFLTPEDSKHSHFESGAFKVLYVYTIDDGKHTGRLKVGDATFHTPQTLDEIVAESNSLNPFGNSGHYFSTPGITTAAKRRIDEQTKTADVEYTLLWSILAVKPVFEENSPIPTYIPFRDHEVHNILKRNMIGTSHHRSDKKVGEWFETDLSVIQAAINFLQTDRMPSSITATHAAPEVTLRKEQKDAVAFTKRHFKNGTAEKPKEILWSAIMRFGKTLTTYETVKQSPDIKKVLIITHRPVVSDGWYEDFNKIFPKNSEVHFSSKRWGETWEQVKDQTDFFYFASIQDLRGSFTDGNVEDPKKNAEIFATDWDLIVTDEAHEGTSTLLAETMYDNIKAKYWLHLSGTPFNIVENFEQTHIYKWDYIDEQKARKQWAIDYPLDSNPYDSLPTIEIFTYDISENYKLYKDASTLGFDFGKFFKVSEETAVSKNGKTYRKFRDEKSVWDLLNLMTRSDDYVDDKREFPFSTIENVDTFNHTFWLIPSVESSLALEEMLARHPVFRHYAVVNVTADNFEGDSALAAVQKAIKENDRTITLSYGRLTTGVTVPEWNGVLLMSNLQSPMTYMQTIFRVKSGGILPGGKTKDKGYVFDFAPDRTLTMVAHASQLTRDSIEEKREAVEELLEHMPIHYIPIISDAGSRFQKFDTDALMRTLNRVYISKAVNSGFETPLLYNFDSHKVSSEDVEKFMKLQKTVGKHTSTNSKSVKINESQLSENDASVLKKKRSDLETPIEKKQWDEAYQAKDADSKNRRAIIAVLNSVSVRIPLMVFAAPPATKVTVDNLTDLIDEKSWDEFMPKGFTKSGESSSWESVKEFYDKTIFEGACEEIQDRVRLMDDMCVLDRVAAVANLFSTFRNPDKETILTPWSVVNRQYADTLGGLRMVDNAGRWFTEDASGKVESNTWEDIQDNELTLAPQWISVDEDLKNFWNNDYTTILDLNSKTALYPLYGAVSLWFRLREQYLAAAGEVSRETEDEIWTEVVENQIFVNCRVPYSKSIAQRVLAGYGSSKINGSVVDVLDIRRKLIDEKVKKEDQKSVWKWLFNPKNLDTATERANEVLTSENLTEIIAKAQAAEVDGFRAIVSNPPYQISNEGNSHQVYPYFYEVSCLLGDRVSMVYPLGWQTSSGAGTGSGFHKEMRSDLHLSRVNNFYENQDSPEILFVGAGTGGVSIVLWSKDYSSELTDFYEYGEFVEKKDFSKVVIWSDETNKLFEKIENWRDQEAISSVKSKVTGRDTFGLSGTYTSNPQKAEYSITTKDHSDTSVKFWTRNKHDSKYSWWFIPKTTESLRIHNSDLWKLVWPKSGAPTNWRRTMIFAPNEFFSDTFICAFFETKAEAENFESYFKTKFYRFMISETASDQNAYSTVHRFVPDLAEVTNPRTGLVGYASDWTDEDLKKLFEDVLTPDDWDYIEKTAIESDPVGAKK